MKSTGVHWKPLFNVLEAQFTVVLANAAHVKAVPGRKTDVRDSEWLLDLRQHGLTRGSCIPAAPIRELRDLTRYRTSLIQERTREVNHIQKVLEDATITLAAVARDMLGVSGRQMPIVAGETDRRRLADLAKRKLQRQQAEWGQALAGRVKALHRLLLRELRDHIDCLNQTIERVSGAIVERTRPFAPFAAALELLGSTAGVQQRTAEVLLVETGTGISRFPSARHRCSWAAVRVTDVSSGAQFRRVARRHGGKRAVVAAARRLLTVGYHILAQGVRYEEPGAAFFDRLEPNKLGDYHIRRLAELGYDVQLAPRPAA